MIVVWLVLTLTGGSVFGYVLACTQVPRMIARMSAEQIDRLGTRVAELREYRDGAS